jgi:hypothetical protein
VPNLEVVAKKAYDVLPAQDQLRVIRWRDFGASWSDALINSGVLARSSSPRVTPEQDRWNRAADEVGRTIVWNAERFSRFGGRRQAAEHEASHVVCGEAVGLDVRGGFILDDGSGKCLYRNVTSNFQEAVIAAAAEMWINRFRTREFPGGASGCESDRRAVIAAVREDDFALRRALEECHQILRDNVASVLAVADAIERDGVYVRALRNVNRTPR